MGRQLPADTVFCGRGTVWGNPFPAKDKSLAERTRVVRLYSDYLASRPDLQEQARTKLQGKNLACPGCPEDGLPCHCDVLLEVANAKEAEA